MNYETLSDFDLLILVVGDAAHYLKKRPLSELLGLKAPRQGVLCDSAQLAVPPALGAIKELFVRAANEAVRDDVNVAKDPSALTTYLSAKYAALEYEMFICVWLDPQHRILDCEEMFRGTLGQTSVYPREVVKSALGHNAKSVVLCHNHPSGVLTVSAADKSLTDTLKRALALIDVCVLDHVIVGNGKSASMAMQGLM